VVGSEFSVFESKEAFCKTTFTLHERLFILAAQAKINAAVRPATAHVLNHVATREKFADQVLELLPRESVHPIQCNVLAKKSRVPLPVSVTAETTNQNSQCDKTAENVSE